jgi:hypothetical protein
MMRPIDQLKPLNRSPAEEPTRRLRKRRQDLLDILMLVEDFAEAAGAVADLSTRLRALQAELMRIAE